MRARATRSRVVCWYFSGALNLTRARGRSCPAVRHDHDEVNEEFAFRHDETEDATFELVDTAKGPRRFDYFRRPQRCVHACSGGPRARARAQVWRGRLMRAVCVYCSGGRSRQRGGAAAGVRVRACGRPPCGRLRRRRGDGHVVCACAGVGGPRPRAEDSADELQQAVRQTQQGAVPGADAALARARAAMRVRAGAHPARLLVRAQPGKRRDDRPRAHRAEASVKVAHDWELLEQVELTQVCACGGGGGALALRPC